MLQLFKCARPAGLGGYEALPRQDGIIECSAPPKETTLARHALNVVRAWTSHPWPRATRARVFLRFPCLCQLPAPASRGTGQWEAAEKAGARGCREGASACAMRLCVGRLRCRRPLWPLSAWEEQSLVRGVSEDRRLGSAPSPARRTPSCKLRQRADGERAAGGQRSYLQKGTLRCASACEEREGQAATAREESGPRAYCARTHTDLLVACLVAATHHAPLTVTSA